MILKKLATRPTRQALLIRSAIFASGSSYLPQYASYNLMGNMTIYLWYDETPINFVINAGGTCCRAFLFQCDHRQIAWTSSTIGLPGALGGEEHS